MEKISDLMFNEHRQIDNILSDVAKEVGNNLQESKIRFNEFLWRIQKHFFLEEKAIFSIYEKIIGKEIDETFELMKEHGEIMEIIKNIEDGLEKDVGVDISNLRTTLLKHASLEDNTFYPKLDEILPEQDKEEIINKIKEII